MKCERTPLLCIKGELSDLRHSLPRRCKSPFWRHCVSLHQLFPFKRVFIRKREGVKWLELNHV